jgi:hypothetical protein
MPKGNRKKAGALGLSFTCAVALLGMSTPTKLTVGIFSGAIFFTLLYALSGFVRKKSLSIAEQMGHLACIVIVSFGIATCIGWYSWPQTFSATIEWAMTSNNMGEGNGLWIEQNGVLYYAPVSLFLRVTNKQSSASLISNYSVEVQLDNEWKSLTVMPTDNTALVMGRQDIRKFNFVKGLLLDKALDNRNLAPGESVRGWALFGCLPHGIKYSPRKFRISIKDTGGNEHVTDAIYADGPTPELLSTEFIVGAELNPNTFQFGSMTCQQ